jgi:ketosteroid isomerase-like protein
MRLSIGIVLCVVGCLATARAQVAAPEQAIRELETRRFQAMEKGDVVTLEQILSDDLIYTHADGRQQSKFDLLGVLGSSDLRYEFIRPYDLRVRVHGDAAVVAGRAAIRLNAHGQVENFEICYLNVYVRQEGRWQMVAWQSSRLPSRESPGVAGRPSSPR